MEQKDDSDSTESNDEMADSDRETESSRNNIRKRKVHEMTSVQEDLESVEIAREKVRKAKRCSNCRSFMHQAANCPNVNQHAGERKDDRDRCGRHQERSDRNQTDCLLQDRSDRDQTDRSDRLAQDRPNRDETNRDQTNRDQSDRLR